MARRPKRTLTDVYCRNQQAAPDGTRDRTPDTEVPGLEFQVTDKGHKSFVLVARYPGTKLNPKTGYPNPIPRALGEYGVLSLEDAREKARAWRAKIRAGIDPAEEERRQAEEEARRREAQQRERENTFERVAEAFIKRHVKGQRRARDAERDIRRYLIARWGERQLDTIKRRDVIQMVEEIVDEGKLAMARNVLGYAKTLFGWCIARDLLEHSPADRVDAAKLIGEKVPRQRVLTDDELFAFWRASGRLGYPFGPLYRLLLLTGARKSEAAGATWSELHPALVRLLAEHKDGPTDWRAVDQAVKVWTVPPERFKSGASHLVPLTHEALAVLETLPRFGEGEHLFSTTFGKVAVSGFSKSKARLDREMRRTLKALAQRRGDDPKRVELMPFVIHDIRRTVRTRLASLRVPEAVAEMVIGHGRKGLQRIYDQHTYSDEMREALDLWAGRLRDIVSPAPANVVRLRTA